MTLTPGFVLNEAYDLAAICGIVEGENLIQPGAWKPLFTSPQLGPFENLWALWQNGTSNQYAVAIRGTVDEAGSIVEDLVSVLVPAQFQLSLDGITAQFQYAAQPGAGVHLGFMIGSLYLLLDPVNLLQNSIVEQLDNLVPPGSDVYITGHSQGAAVACLVSSYLAYNNYLTPPKGYGYKTYAFAEPRPGNDHYSWDFEQAVGRQGYTIRVTNPLDWVPQVPLTLEWLQDVNTPNPLIRGTLSTALEGVIHTVLELRGASASAYARTQLADLAKVLTSQGIASATPGAAPSLSIMPSLNFMPAGGEIALQPDPSFTNPNDVFCQHHIPVYMKLLQNTFGS